MKHSLLFLLLLIVFSSTYSQSKEIIFISKYGQKDGLPSYNVRKVSQDSKGFIWVGTQDGISRFNGKSFLNYSKSSLKKHRIYGVDVRDFFEDTATDLLWVLPGEIGIHAISVNTGEVTVSVPIPNDSTEDWNLCMTRSNQKIWIGRSTGVRVFNMSNNSFQSSPVSPARKSDPVNLEVRSIIKDEYGKMWVGYSGFGIVVYDDQTNAIIKTIPIADLNDHNKSQTIKFNNAVVLKPGEILYATSQGLRKISYNSTYTFNIDNTPCKTVPLLNSENIEHVRATSDGNILVSGYNRLYRFNLDLVNATLLQEPPRSSEADWLNAVQNIYQDSQANIWLGCQEGLAFISKNKTPFTLFNYDPQTKTVLDHVRSLCLLNDSSMLVGLRNGIVHIRPPGNHYTKYDTGHLYHHIFQDHKGQIHVSRPDEMFIFKNGMLSPIAQVYPEFAPYSSYAVNSHLFLGDSLVIMGTENDNGILLWYPLKKIVQKISRSGKNPILYSNIVNNIYKDSRERIWVLSDNVISVLDPTLKTGRKLPLIEKETDLPYRLFFDMCQVNNEYWIASYGAGILQLDSNANLKKVFSVKNGLSDDGVYQVFPIQNKQLIVTSNNGISVIDLSAFTIKNYFSKNGLHSNSFEEVAGIMANGKVIAGGPNGFTVIDPEYFSLNATPPAVFLTNVVMQAKNGLIDTSNLAMKLIRIGNNIIQTTLSFSALNYYNPDRTSILYKIKEQPSDWLAMGPTNSLPLIGFRPGKYHLVVQAFNEDKVPSEVREFTLIVEPKWYQTIAFRIFLVLLFLASIYGLYRLRLNQLKKEQEIRSKLASDLHDDLGSTLNSVKVYTNLALMEEDKTKYLPRIKENIQEAITGVKDLIWVLDDSKNTVEDLLLRINQFGAPLCQAHDINYKTEMSDQVRGYQLPRAEKRNLYMVLKEAINNTCKYSNGSQVVISVYLVNKKIRVIITDNGDGFDISAATSGNGLKNIKLRAAQIKYGMEILTSAGSGTTIKLEKA